MVIVEAIRGSGVQSLISSFFTGMASKLLMNEYLCSLLLWHVLLDFSLSVLTQVEEEQLICFN